MRYWETGHERKGKGLYFSVYKVPFFNCFLDQEPSIFTLHWAPLNCVASPAHVQLACAYLTHFISSLPLSCTSLSDPGVLAGQRAHQAQSCHLTCALLFPLLGTVSPHLSMVTSSLWFFPQISPPDPDSKWSTPSLFTLWKCHPMLITHYFLLSVIFLPTLKVSRRMLDTCLLSLLVWLVFLTRVHILWG